MAPPSAPALEALRAHHLFAALDDAQFVRATVGAEVVELAPAQLLFQRGDPARAFYVVLAGEVRLALQSRGGDEKVVERLGPGQSFGEALMFLESPTYPLAALAVDAARVIGIECAGFLAMLRESPDTCLRLLADLSRRLHARIREIEELSFASATHRLVQHLFALAPEGAARGPGPLTVTLDESRQVLAARLAIQPETLSRILRGLADAGAIRVEGRLIELRDLARLRATA